MDFPERIKTWTALSIPHIGVFFNSIENHPEQKERSGYMQKLKLPFIPELVYHLNHKKFLKRMEGSWKPYQIEEYEAIQKEYGAVSAAINWYRAMDVLNENEEQSFYKKINRPTLFLWGTEDPVLAPEIIPLQEPYIETDYQELSFKTGHALVQTETEGVLKAMVSHWKKYQE